MSTPSRFWKDTAFWIALVSAAYLAAEMSHGRFHQTDFGAYTMAASRFLGGRELYSVVEGHATVNFLYPPPVALCFVPFTLVGFGAAKLAWYFLNTVLIVVIWKLLQKQAGRTAWLPVLFFFLAVGFALERELHVGNVNLATLALCLWGVSGTTARRPATAGFALSVAVMTKPQNGLVALPLARRRPRLAVWTGAFFLFGLLAPLPFYGPAGTRDLYAAFFTSASSFAASSVHNFKYASTTAALWERVLGLFGPDLSGHPSSLVVGLLASLAVIVLAYRKYAGGPAAVYVAMAMIPLIVAGDYQVFVFAAPLVYHLLRCASRSSWGTARKGILAIALILYGGNWHDLWGDRLSDLFLEAGVRGIGTWILVGMALAGGKATAPER